MIHATMGRLMNKIFSIQKLDTHKIVRFMGLKFKLKNPDGGEIMRLFDRMTQNNLSTFALHQKTFLPFKEKHIGQDIVIFASGPTAKDYKPVKGAVHIGVNRSFAVAPVKLDYIFIQDYTGKTPEYIDDVAAYEPKKCTKFYGLIRENVYEKPWTVPESCAIKAGALRYRTDWMLGFKPQFAYDISCCPLGDFGSTTFSALQFALWTYPRRIYLVGCDCTTGGYVYNAKEKNSLAVKKVIAAYKQFKKFAGKFYPDVEIISVNPVGLKGIFKDEYTK